MFGSIGSLSMKMEKTNVEIFAAEKFMVRKATGIKQYFSTTTVKAEVYVNM